MKVLYITSPSFFDADLSFVRSMSKKVDLVFLIDLSKHHLNSTALQISKQIDKCGIIKANQYSEFSLFSNYLNQESYVINRPKSKIFSLETLKINIQLHQFIKKLKPDVIHFNHFFNIGIFGCTLNKFKKIITIHDPIPHIGDDTFGNRLKRNINKFFIKKYILLNMSQFEEFIVKNNIPRKDVYLSKLGVYEYYSEKLSQVNIKQANRNTILFFGRISRYKGINILVKAFEIVKRKHPYLKLIIAGKGELNIDVKSDILLLNRYIFPDELLKLIYECSFVVCPYIEATQSGVVMTAFSLKKPVLATNVGGLPEMVDHNITGYLCEPNSVEKLSKSIERLIENNDLLKNYSINIEKNYFDKGKNSWELISNGVVKIYNSL